MFFFRLLDEEQVPNDFSPDQGCLFCINRQEYLGNKRINEHHHSIQETIIDDDENAPLDLSLKPTTTNNKSPLITSNNRTNIKLVLIESHFKLSLFYYLDNDHCLISSQIYHQHMVKKNLIILCLTLSLVN